jgi:hypothetical protein
VQITVETSWLPTVTFRPLEFLEFDWTAHSGAFICALASALIVSLLPPSRPSTQSRFCP